MVLVEQVEEGVAQEVGVEVGAVEEGDQSGGVGGEVRVEGLPHQDNDLLLFQTCQ